eukprot:4842925-Amphidinium_carterae.4
MRAVDEPREFVELAVAAEQHVGTLVYREDLARPTCPVLNKVRATTSNSNSFLQSVTFTYDTNVVGKDIGRGTCNVHSADLIDVHKPQEGAEHRALWDTCTNKNGPSRRAVVFQQHEQARVLSAVESALEVKGNKDAFLLVGCGRRTQRGEAAHDVIEVVNDRGHARLSRFASAISELLAMQVDTGREAK